MEPTMTLKLPQQDVAIVLEALGNMPLGRVLNTFARIQQQVAEQQGRAPGAEVANGLANGNGHATPDSGG